MKGIQDTSSKTYRQIMGNGLRYEIPKFQRNYTWGQEQWDDLWQDLEGLIKNEESEHYLGYLVLQTNDSKNLSIIDGQQRLTTMSLLILAVLKSLQNLAENNIDAQNNIKRKETLQNSYIGYVDPVTLIPNNKLKLNRNSDDYYRNYLVLLKTLPNRNNNSSEKQMREAFNWYVNKVSATYKTGEALAKFIDNVVDKICFTVIEVSDQLNAFKVFETLNARGVQLSSSDLLKNYLFSVVDAQNPHKTEIDELEKIWGSVVDKLVKYKFEDYLRYYWNSISKTVRKNNLFKSIKTTITTKGQAFTLLRSLQDNADLFVALQNPHDDFWQGNQDISSALNTLILFNIKQTNSLLMAGYNNLDTPHFVKLLNNCVIVSFRYNVICGLNPNEQEGVYNDIARKINIHKTVNVNDFKPIYVDDDAFVNAFSRKDFKSSSRNYSIVKYIFAKLSAHHNQLIEGQSEQNSIEHILPQSADENWGEFDDEAINRSVDRLGNLTLIETKLNRSAGTLVFAEKIKIYQQSQFALTNEIGNYANWNENALVERQKALAKTAKSVWKIPAL